LLLKSQLTEEDWERGSESFPYLPITLLAEGKRSTVCEMIPNAKDGNRWLNALLNEEESQRRYSVTIGPVDGLRMPERKSSTPRRSFSIDWLNQKTRILIAVGQTNPYRRQELQTEVSY
jgi:hypothetical protein